jgi:hypothetical protein
LVGPGQSDVSDVCDEEQWKSDEIVRFPTRKQKKGPNPSEKENTDRNAATKNDGEGGAGGEDEEIAVKISDACAGEHNENDGGD